MQFLIKFIWFCFSLSFPFLSCIAEFTLPKNISVPAVFFFGDSLVDTGNNNYFISLANIDYPPYGHDFMGGKATGRYSNGKVPSDLFVEGFGIKPLLPPYLDPNLKDEDLVTGVNFASGGAGYDPKTSRVLIAIPLSKQLELFEEYITKLKWIVGEDRTYQILRESIFVTVFGANDITLSYYGPNLQRFHYDISSYADKLVSISSGFVQNLYSLGVRRIGVLGLAPIGCAPIVRTLMGGLGRKCADKVNRAAILINDKMSAELISVNSRLPGARMILMDIYQPLLDIIDNPDKYGFKVINKSCCGTGTEFSLTCDKSHPSVCSNVSEYIFWDNIHPTERVYNIIVPQILEKYVNNFI